MSDFQTLTFIKQELARRGLRPTKGLGQHFLIDGNLLRLMVEAAGVGQKDLVLEVGCGTGGLTALLAERAGHVVAVELDRQLLEIAHEVLAETDTVTFWPGDVLAGKHALAPELLELITQLLTERAGSTLKMVSDLPYSVAMPVTINLWESELPLELMVVTIQRELAEKVVARPGSRAYGALTVKLAVWAEAEILRVLRPSVFWPRPQVDSAFVRMRRRERPLVSRAHYGRFSQLVDLLFRHRRKTSARALQLAAKELEAETEVAASPAEAGAETRRVEQLTMADLIALARAFKPHTHGHTASGQG